jgi:hypothetical protein
MEAVYIGRGAPAQTSMNHTEELAKVRHPSYHTSQGMNNVYIKNLKIKLNSKPKNAAKTASTRFKNTVTGMTATAPRMLNGLHRTKHLSTF